MKFLVRHYTKSTLQLSGRWLLYDCFSISTLLEAYYYVWLYSGFIVLYALFVSKDIKESCVRYGRSAELMSSETRIEQKHAKNCSIYVLSVTDASIAVVCQFGMQ